MALYDKIVNPDLLIRRLNISVNHVIDESQLNKKNEPVQLDLFIDYKEELKAKEEEKKQLAKERRIQEAQIAIKKRFGKNAILNGVSFAEGATAKERNSQIGGHKA
jgi:DNA polymerase V